MTSDSPRSGSRRTVFINPRFQGGIALCFGAVILGGAALFAWFFYLSSSSSLLAASFRGHYHFLRPFEIIGGSVVRHLLLLLAGTAAACLLLVLLLVRRIRGGVDRLLETFRLSMEGDLSTPTEAPGLSDLRSLGTRIDGIRSLTLEQIRGLRAEAEFLRREPLTEEEFAGRWEALKRSMQRVAP